MKSIKLINKIAGFLLPDNQQVEPVENDFIRTYLDDSKARYVDSVYRVKQPQSPDETMRIAIVSTKVDGIEQADDYHLKIKVGSNTSHKLEARNAKDELYTYLNGAGDITLAGGSDGHYVIPVESFKGGTATTLEVQFEFGKAEIVFDWHNKGVYLITEENINAFLPKDKKILFDGAVFSVY